LGRNTASILALVEPLARVGQHRLLFHTAAIRACDDRFCGREQSRSARPTPDRGRCCGGVASVGLAAIAGRLTFPGSSNAPRAERTVRQKALPGWCPLAGHRRRRFRAEGRMTKPSSLPGPKKSSRRRPESRYCRHTSTAVRSGAFRADRRTSCRLPFNPPWCLSRSPQSTHLSPSRP